MLLSGQIEVSCLSSRVGKSTIDELVIEVCEEINYFISLRAVKIESTAEVMMRFEQMGFLNCASTTDHTHILVLCLWMYYQDRILFFHHLFCSQGAENENTHGHIYWMHSMQCQGIF